MTDYWLNKLIFDLQGPNGKDRWRNDREALVDEYPVSPEIRAALMADDYDTLQPLVNPYLMRFFLLMCGLDDEGSIKVLNEIGERQKEAANG